MKHEDIMSIMFDREDKKDLCAVLVRSGGWIGGRGRVVTLEGEPDRPWSITEYTSYDVFLRRVYVEPENILGLSFEAGRTLEKESVESQEPLPGRVSPET